MTELLMDNKIISTINVLQSFFSCERDAVLNDHTHPADWSFWWSGDEDHPQTSGTC